MTLPKEIIELITMRFNNTWKRNINNKMKGKEAKKNTVKNIIQKQKQLENSMLRTMNQMLYSRLEKEWAELEEERREIEEEVKQEKCFENDSQRLLKNVI